MIKEGMEMRTILSAALIASLAVSAANAGEWADACVERLEADGRDTSGCSCLEEEIDGDDALIEEFTELGEIDDPAERYASASEDAKAVMDACTR